MPHACRYPPCLKNFETTSGRLRHELKCHRGVVDAKEFKCTRGCLHNSRHAARQCESRKKKEEGAPWFVDRRKNAEEEKEEERDELIKLAA